MLGRSAAQSQGAWRSFLDWLEDPVVLEVAAISVGVLLVLWLLWSVRSSLTKLHGRRHIVKYLDGVEAALAGDHKMAAALLGEVVTADPENLGARLYLGDALRRLGRPVEAHRQHVEAREVSENDGPALQLRLIQDLHEAGESADALERLEDALERWPRDPELLEAGLEVYSSAGRFEDALKVGRSLQSISRDDARRERLASLACQVAYQRLQKGERESATRFFREALASDEQHELARIGLAIADPGRGEERGERLLSVAEELALPAGRADEALALANPDSSPSETRKALVTTIDAQLASDGDASPIERSARGLQTIAGLLPSGRCTRCGAVRAASPGACPSCGALGKVAHDDDDDRELADAAALLDEIDENDAWFQALSERLLQGDNDAEHELRESGGRALPALLAAYVEGREAHDAERLLSLCVEIGRREPELLIEAQRAFANENRPRLYRLLQRGDVDHALGAVFRALGASVRPAFEAVLADPGGLADAGLRQLVLDYFVGLADAEAFEMLASRFSPVEIVRHLNGVPDDELVPLFGKLRAGRSFLREAILEDAALDRPAALVAAALAADGEAVEAWVALFKRRGPGTRVARALVQALECEDDRAERAEVYLDRFARSGRELLVAAFADPASEARALPALERLLHSAGRAAIPELVQVFAANPTAVDDRTAALLTSFGELALKDLEAAYRGSAGWLGKLGARLFRAKHPRTMILRTIAAIGGTKARLTLRRLQDAESDAELSSLIEQLLREKQGGEGGDA